MFEITYDYERFSKIFRLFGEKYPEILLTISKDRVVLKSIDRSILIAATIFMSKKDHLKFKCTNKKSVQIMLDSGKVLKVLESMSLPFKFMNDGKNAVKFQSDRAELSVDLIKNEDDIYKRHDKITELHTKDNSVKFMISADTLNDIIENLKKVNISLKNGDVIFGERDGSLKVKDVCGNPIFELKSSFSLDHLKLISDVVPYSSDEIFRFYVKKSNDPDKNESMIVEVNIGENSTAKFIVAST